MLIPLTSIYVADRFRKDLGPIEDLMASLTEFGLIQPIVVAEQDDPQYPYRLIAGGRRTTSAGRLGWQEIEAFVKPNLTDRGRQIMVEMEENLQREDMRWQEKVMGIAAVHKEHQRQAHLEGKRWTEVSTGKLVGQSRAYVNYSVALAELVEAGDEEIIKCENVTDAIGKMFDRAQRRVELERDNRRKAALDAQKKAAPQPQPVNGKEHPLEKDVKVTEVPAPPSDLNLYEQASSIVHVADVHTHTYDRLFTHVYCDIPYGIDMDHLDIKHQEETEDEHDRDANIELFPKFLQLAHDRLHSGGFCIFWCDMEHWTDMLRLAVKTGFSAQRWPLIWNKTGNCKNAVPRYNWTKSFEVAMCLRKGQATLTTPQTKCVWTGDFAPGERAKYKHPFCKPAALHKWVLDAFTRPGDSIFIPYCGEGSEVLACLRNGLEPQGYDLVEAHIIRAKEHIINWLKEPKQPDLV